MTSSPQGASTSHSSTTTHADPQTKQGDPTSSSDKATSTDSKNNHGGGEKTSQTSLAPLQPTSSSTPVVRAPASASVEEPQRPPNETSRSHSPTLQSGATPTDAASPPSTSKARASSATAPSTANSSKASTSSSRKSSSSMTKSGSRSSKSKSARSSKGEATDMSGDESSNAQLQPKQEEQEGQSLAPENTPNDQQPGASDADKKPKSESGQAESTSHSRAAEGSEEAAEQEAADSSSNDTSIGQGRRQRSASTKELAGLGLAHLGDGEEEILPPRRSRRAVAASPSTEGKQLPDDSMQADEKAGEASQAGKDTTSPDVSMDSVHASKANQEQTVAELEEPLAEAEEGLLVGPGAADEDGEGDIEGVTRCVCGSTDENVGLMIQCETCKCWQHCVCMGMHTEEDCPDVYYCEQCKPELHIPLLRALGVLPSARSHKKGASRLNGKNPAKEAAKELREAREAVAVLAKQNAQRRRDGIEPLVATTVPLRGRRTTSESQESSVDKVPPSPRTNATSEGPHATPSSNTSAGGAPGGSASSASGRRSPKRRSTMNSRDSTYGGWEAIPPGLLNEDEVWDDGAKREEEDAAGRKRKRATRRDDEPSPSPAASPQMGPAELAKRRRMSGSASRDAARKALSPNPTESALALSPTGGSERSLAASRKANGAAGATSSGGGSGSGSKSGAAASNASAARNRHSTEEASAAPSSSSATGHLHPSGAANGNGSNGPATPAAPPTKPKQPNQYTHRKERASAAAAALAAGAGRTVSPTPSPSKSGRRGAAALREGSTVSQSRNGTPVPGDSKNNKGAPWGMPDHLSHLAHLLPSAQPEPLQLHMPTTKGLGRNADSHHGSSTGARPSPHAFNILDLSEPPTKVRFPSKRMTMGEMRKRVRNISEYVTRTQLEAVERGKRMKALGITLSPESYIDAAATAAAEGNEENTQMPAQAEAEAGATPMEGVEAATANGEDKDSAAVKGEASAGASAKEAPAPIPLSMHLLDDLSRQIIAFQQKFGVPPGTSGPGPLSGASTSANTGSGSTPATGAEDGSATATTGLGLGL